MMNGLALCFVLTTLVTAGVWPSSPERNKPSSAGEDVIVKEGHRVVVVEFEKDDGNTKVSISPQESHLGPVHKFAEDAAKHGYGVGENLKEKLTESADEAKEKLKEAYPSSDAKHGFSGPRELVCDAFGKCKHKIASALGKTKDKVSEKAHEAAEKAYEVEEEAREAVGGSVGKAKDKAVDKTHEVANKAREAKEKVKETASDVSSKAREAVSEKAREVSEKVKDAAADASSRAKEAIVEKARAAKEGAKDVIDIGKTLKADVERNASQQMDRAKTEVVEKAKTAEEMAETGKEEAKKDIKEILRRGLEVVKDAFGYVFSKETLGSTMGVIHLLGFATAYGMNVWVTFASSYVLARALPRQQFAMVQSKIYPVYFKAMAYSIGMALLGHLLMSRGKHVYSSASEMFQGLNLLGSLLMVMGNLLYLEPRATKVMFERLKLEKEEGRGTDGFTGEPVVDKVGGPSTARTSGATTTTPSPLGGQERLEDAASKVIKLSQKLKKLNSYSSFLNILTLVALTWHLVDMGQVLHSAC